MANTKILYLEANKRNFINKFLLHNQGYYLRDADGRIDNVKRQHPDPPWIYTKSRENQNCHYWHKVLFNVIHGQGAIPGPCMNCWKVVLMPRNLEELFATYFLQLSLNRPSKCGTEGDRENTDRLYGAYFYNMSREQGQECYETVKKAMEQSGEIEHVMFGVPLKAHFYREGEEMKFSAGTVKVAGLPNLILKRGCTEYEQNVGASDTWESLNSEGKDEIEWLAKDSFNQDTPQFKQSDHQIAHVIEKWIHNAFRWGDQSYLKFTNNNRLFAPPVTYHQDPGGTADGKERP